MGAKETATPSDEEKEVTSNREKLEIISMVDLKTIVRDEIKKEDV